ncbi:MAG: CRISPR-associated endonuclease Cas2 [Chloroflexi bacterium]|nr:CRISPR-associated endonuclease Cas2 [Chloroflexota bacterium]
MAHKQFVVVTYDISNDRRRTRLHNLLLSYGTPVQYSVFECLLDAEELARMKRAVTKAIRPRLDRVRYYYLCESCLAKTEVTSGPEALHDQETIVI